MERRTLLKRAFFALNGLFGAVLGIPALVYLADPRNRPAPKGDFKPVAKLDDLVEGVPTQAVIRDVRKDAWTLHPSDTIGRVWLLKKKDGGIDAFTTICPHLGCSINHTPNAAFPFTCPCHNGAFKLTGELVTAEELGRNNAPPRGMDKLETQIHDGVVLVRYENFIQGLHEQVKKA